MPALVPVITNDGLAAAFNADQTGLAATISHIAVGTASYTPNGTEQALSAQQGALIPIADGSIADTHQIHLTSLLQDSSDYWIREVGFFLDDGTLFAIWSHSSQPLAYKTSGVDLLLAFDLLLKSIPADSITVNSTGANMSLYYAEDFAKMLKVSADAAHRDVNHDDALAVLTELVRIQQNAINCLSRELLGRDLLI